MVAFIVPLLCACESLTGTCLLLLLLRLNFERLLKWSITKSSEAKLLFYWCTGYTHTLFTFLTFYFFFCPPFTLEFVAVSSDTRHLILGSQVAAGHSSPSSFSSTSRCASLPHTSVSCVFSERERDCVLRSRLKGARGERCGHFAARRSCWERERERERANYTLSTGWK